MRPFDLSTLPHLAAGEPGCHDIATLGQAARTAILSAYLGTLRRAGSHWYGPDKRSPINRRTIAALIERRLIYSSDPNTARITKRGQWCARTIGSEIAGTALHTSNEEGALCRDAA